MSALNKKVESLKRRYKYVNESRFLYKHPQDLKKKHTNIKLWILIYEEDRGHTIFETFLKTRSKRTVEQWAEFISSKTKPFPSERTYRKRKYHKAGIQIIEDHILESINAKFQSQWEFVDLIGWTFINL